MRRLYMGCGAAKRRVGPTSVTVKSFAAVVLAPDRAEAEMAVLGLTTARFGARDGWYDHSCVADPIDPGIVARAVSEALSG